MEQTELRIGGDVLAGVPLNARMGYLSAIAATAVIEARKLNSSCWDAGHGVPVRTAAEAVAASLGLDDPSDVGAVHDLLLEAGAIGLVRVEDDWLKSQFSD